MYERQIIITRKYKQDIKRLKLRNYPLVELELLLSFLIYDKNLPIKYKLHLLVGTYATFFECHIRPDWLLIYRVYDSKILLHRTGTHSDLFKK